MFKKITTILEERKHFGDVVIFNDLTCHHKVITQLGGIDIFTIDGIDNGSQIIDDVRAELIPLRLH